MTTASGLPHCTIGLNSLLPSAFSACFYSSLGPTPIMEGQAPVTANRSPCEHRARRQRTGPGLALRTRHRLAYALEGEARLSLPRQLAQRAAEGRPIRIGLVGAGKFGTMFLSQLRLTTGMHLTALSDLVPGRATERLTGVQWPADRIDARPIDEAIRTALAGPLLAKHARQKGVVYSARWNASFRGRNRPDPTIRAPSVRRIEMSSRERRHP